jgi:hypothetical protein
MRKLTLPTALVLTLGIIIATAVILLAMGRNPICKCGYVLLWHPVKGGPGGSQHLIDWYTFTHIQHGPIFYLLIWLVFRDRVSTAGKLVLAVLMEAGWEIAENTDFIINRYRSGQISADYVGDSVVNSVADILAMIVGFLAAAILPAWGAVLVFVGVEATLLYLIRDSLLLNALMLIYRVPFIERWQAGG